MSSELLLGLCRNISLSQKKHECNGSELVIEQFKLRNHFKPSDFAYLKDFEMVPGTANNVAHVMCELCFYSDVLWTVNPHLPHYLQQSLGRVCIIYAYSIVEWMEMQIGMLLDEKRNHGEKLKELKAKNAPPLKVQKTFIAYFDESSLAKSYPQRLKAYLVNFRKCRNDVHLTKSFNIEEDAFTAKNAILVAQYVVELLLWAHENLGRI